TPRRQLSDGGALVHRVVDDAGVRDEHPVVVDAPPLQLAADAPKLERIIENLLVNAARHTPAGTTIWVRLHAQDDGVLLLVEDEGPGVPVQLREEIFQPFRQGRNIADHAPGSRHRPGPGLPVRGPPRRSGLGPGPPRQGRLLPGLPPRPPRPGRMRSDLVLDRLAVPVVLAPLGGGPSTPELTAAVSNAGGLGFLAAGYLAASALAERLERTRTLTEAPIGVNLFVPGRPAPPQAVDAYAASLADEGRRAGVELGVPRFDDDDWAAKLELLAEVPVPVVSFTFGCPAPEVLGRLDDVGSEVWVTVTGLDEARLAATAGADALVLQGAEAGGHRASFRDDPAQAATGGIGLLSLLQLVRAQVDLPLVATGGIATGAAIAAVLAAGAAAAQLGTAFLGCPEAGTAVVHRQALAGSAPTAMTRAFTGRLARGIRNRFLDRYSAAAPAAYPELHHLTAPLRQAGRAAGDPGLVNLWAGQTYELGRQLPAGQLVRALAEEARAALQQAGQRLPGGDVR
ncbi:MAG TPA: nitronate monooxygenase, partial [Actinomycetes bacterium]|nr:nitronate monooxygenase [Actinomycetes bacterium]